MYRILLLSAFVLLGGCVISPRVVNHGAAPGSETCARISEAEVKGLFDRWNASLATLDANKVTANYTADAVLLPTVSNIPRTNHAEISTYFEKDFLPKHPQGTIDRRWIKIGCNVAQDVGLYTFKLTTGTVQARYTFVYQYTGGSWLISHHHSSGMPQ